MKKTLRQVGDAGEDLAAAALKKQGYRIIERNFSCPLGEVDLIARQGDFLVFVEVKTRRGASFGGAAEAVHPAKQAKLMRLAEYYMNEKRLKEAKVRFDVVAVNWEGETPRVEIIQDAF